MHLAAARRPQDVCDVFLAWHVTEGEKDGFDLSGMNAVHGGPLAEADDRRQAGRSPSTSTTGPRRSSPRRWAPSSPAAAGGHLAAFAPLIGEVAGVAPASITFDRTGTALRADGRDVALDGGRRRSSGMDGVTARRHHEPDCSVPSRSRSRQAQGRRRALPRSLGRRVLGHEQLRRPTSPTRAETDTATSAPALGLAARRSCSRGGSGSALLAVLAWVVTVPHGGCDGRRAPGRWGFRSPRSSSSGS